MDLTYIDKLVDYDLCYLYYEGKPILTASSIGDLKKEIKEHIEAPSDGKKVHVVNFNKTDNKTHLLMVSCFQSTITPQLALIGGESDTGKIVCYSKKDLQQRKFKLSDVNKMIEVIDNGQVSFSTARCSISEILGEQMDLSYIDEMVDYNLCYLYHKGEPILQASNIKNLEIEIQDHFKTPREAIKVHVVAFSKHEDKSRLLDVSCFQSTITPDLCLVDQDSDTGKIVSYSKKELKKRKFKLSDVNKMIKVIDDGLVSFSTAECSISEILSLYDS